MVGSSMRAHAASFLYVGAVLLVVSEAFNGTNHVPAKKMFGNTVSECPSWTEPNLYPPPYVTSDTSLVVVDCTTADNATILAAATLQGAINTGADGARVYLLVSTWDPFWLSTLRHRGLMPNTTTDILQPADFFSMFAQTYDSVVVADEHLPASINVATMIASTIRTAIVIDGSMIGKLGQEKHIIDLRGRWSSSVDAYRWAFRQLYQTGQLHTSTFAYYHPYWLNHHLRDYLLAHKIFTWYISVEDGSDGKALMTEILSKSNPGTVIGFIGGGPVEDPNAFNEYSGVGLLGQYGKLMTAADWSSNLSYLSAMRKAAALLFDAVANYRTRVAARVREETMQPLNKSKVYLSIGVVESGDAPAYWQYRQWQVWNDSARGRIPISWGVGAGVWELSPAIALYFVEKATGEDFLYAAISGLAYVHPYRRFMEALPNSSSMFDTYWHRTRCYLDRLGSSVSGAYTDAQKEFNRNVQDPTTNAIIRGCAPQCETLVLGMGRDDGMNIENGNYYLSGVQVSHILTRWPTDYKNLTREQRISWLVQEICEQLTSAQAQTRPQFIQAMALSWAYGPSEIAEVVAMLPEHVQPVSLPRYQQLSRQAKHLATVII